MVLRNTAWAPISSNPFLDSFRLPTTRQEAVVGGKHTTCDVVFTNPLMTRSRFGRERRCLPVGRSLNRISGMRLRA